MNILIADDNRTNLKLLRAILLSEGHQVSEANDGINALAVLEIAAIDAVISDILMPNMDGYRLCYEVRLSEKFRELPFIFYTAAYTSAGDEKLCMDLGCDVYVRKPASGSELVAAIEKARTSKHRQPDVDLDKSGLLKEYSELLVEKLEEKNLALSQTTEELRRADAQLRHVFAHSPAIIYALRVVPEGVQPYIVSENLTEVLGYTPEEAMSYEWWVNCLHPEDRDDALASIRDTLKFGSGRVEYRMRHKDGAYKWMEEKRRLVTDEESGNKEIIGALADITERKNLEQQLLHSQKMESLGALAGGIAHDFNNLLTGMLGYAELSQMKLAEDSPIQPYLEEIRKAAKRAAELTKQLLMFARKEMVEPSIVNLNELCEGMDKLIRQVLPANIQLSSILSPGLGSVKIDRSQFEQVFMNLAVNARDAMPNGGQLVIETHNVRITEQHQTQRGALEPGNYVQIIVSDSGEGMPKEIQAKVFDPFFTTKEKGKGTGLGLSTCYGIVQNSGGRIWFYSEPGMGTSFKVYLPRVDELAQDSSADLLQDENGNGETILVVEDEPIVLDLVTNALSDRGYDVLRATTANAAIELLSAHKEPIHLLITDLVMPGLSGRELADFLAVVRPSVKILYMSGYTDDALIHRGLLSQNLFFLQKPFAAGTLAHKVREVLDHVERSE